MLLIEQALTLSTGDQINQEISVRHELLGKMVGSSLYPSIVWDEIISLRKRFTEITGTYQYK